MMHVEVVVPSFENRSESRVHFATYLGAQAAFQNEFDTVSGLDFYLIRHGHRWRCMPVFGFDAVEELRRACVQNVGSPYSLLKYPTSSHYLRQYSWIWPDKPLASGHCATISARVLKQAGIQCGLVHTPPWYSPSSLFTAIQSDLELRLAGLAETEFADLKAENQEECNESIERILRGPLSARSLHDVGNERCVAAIRQLAYRVVESYAPGVSASDRCIAERELGDAVLKYSLLGRGQM